MVLLYFRRAFKCFDGDSCVNFIIITIDRNFVLNFVMHESCTIPT